MTPEYQRPPFLPAASTIGKLRARVRELEAALQPFAMVVIGEHRSDEENVWHSLKVHHFRDARKAFKGDKNGSA